MKPRYRHSTDNISDDVFSVCCVRSQYAHATIDIIHIPTLPETVSIIQAHDLTNETITILDGKLPILANKIIHYKGQPILLLVGPCEQQLQKIAHAIQIEYTILTSNYKLNVYELEQIIEQKDIQYGTMYPIENEIQSFHRNYDYYLNQAHTYTPTEATASTTIDKNGNYTLHTSLNYTHTIIRNIHSLLKSYQIPTINILECMTNVNTEANFLSEYYATLYSAIASIITQKPTYCNFQVTHNNTHFINFDYLLEYCKPISHTHDSSLADNNSNNNNDATTIHNAPDSTACTALHYYLYASITITLGAYPLLIQECFLRIYSIMREQYHLDYISLNITIIHTNTPPIGIFKGQGLHQCLWSLEQLFHSFTLYHPQVITHNTLVNTTACKLHAHLLQNFFSEKNLRRKEYAYTMQPPLHYNQTRKSLAYAFGVQYSSFLGSQESYFNAHTSMHLDKQGILHIAISFLMSKYEQEYWAQFIAEEIDIPPQSIIFNYTQNTSEALFEPFWFSHKYTILYHILHTLGKLLKKKRFHSPLPITVRYKYKPRVQSPLYTKKRTPRFAKSHAIAAIEIHLEGFTIYIKKIYLMIFAGKILQKHIVHNRLEAQCDKIIKQIISNPIIYENNIYQIVSTNLMHNMHIQIYQPSKQYRTETRCISSGIGELAYSSIPAAFLIAIEQLFHTHNTTEITPQISPTLLFASDSDIDFTAL